MRNSVPMPLAILYPRTDEATVERRYASWLSELLLRRAVPSAAWVPYGSGETMAEVAGWMEHERCLVLTDPFVLTTRSSIEMLELALSRGGADAAVPVSNAATRPELKAPGAEEYITIRQYEEMSDRIATQSHEPRVIEWNGDDPGLFLKNRASLAAIQATARHALDGKRVIVATNAFVHRWSDTHTEKHLELLNRVPLDAASILDLTCCEGLLGEALRKRQKCHVIGIEPDHGTAALARKRLNDVYSGDVSEIISIIDQKFDFVVGGEILGYRDDPWSFLIDLRRVMADGGRLLLHVPNAANWAVIADLLHGRADYNSARITTAASLHSFTKHSIADALSIAGWDVVSIDPETPVVNREYDTMIAALRAAGIHHSAEELAAPGYYVTARVQ